MTSPNLIFKSLKRKILLIMNTYPTHPPKHVGRGGSFGYLTFQLSNITIAFLPPNLTNVVRKLRQYVQM